MNKDDILKILRANQGQIKDMNINRLALFGSHIKGTVTPNSDIDILVDFEETPDFFEFVRVKERLEKILHNKSIDLVTFQALKSERQRKILDEAEDV